MIPNGFIDKNGGMAFDTMNGSLHKDEMMNNFQTKIGQNMDFDLPPYNSEGNEVAKSYPEEVFHEEIFYYPVDEVIGMISHKKSQITIFGHKHEIKNFIKKIDIFHEKISTPFNFGLYVFGIKLRILNQNYIKND